VQELIDNEITYMQASRKKLVNALQRLFAETRQEQREKSLNPLRWNLLEQKLAYLQDYEFDQEGAEFHSPVMRRLAEDILGIIQEIRPGHLSKDMLRSVQRSALDMQRAAVISLVHHSYQAVLQMDHTLAALREFITAGVRPDEKPRLCKVSKLVEAAVVRMAEFAHSLNVEISRKETTPGVEVRCRERELERAFTNLLHNAIKYSWKRTSSRPPWVGIETKVVGENVCISFENWGVPIPRDEYEVIFQLGFRGRLSRDRHRLGTGIGLTDTRRIAVEHHGTINVHSRPAVPHAFPEGHPDYYNQPFITTFEFIIPLPRRNGFSDNSEASH
jgi:signal transduction histidine kinase